MADMNLAMQNYAMKLGEYVWDEILKKTEGSDLNKTLSEINNGNSTLDQETVTDIIQKLGGTFIVFSDEYSKEKKESEKTSSEESVDDLMRKHLKEKFNVKSDICGDSYFVKLDEKASCFEIGCKRFNLMNSIHELGHLFLDADRCNVNCIIWDDGTLNQSEYLANAFARALIMPLKRFVEKVTMSSDNSGCNIFDVASFFGVEYTNAYIRGKELMLWN